MTRYRRFVLSSDPVLLSLLLLLFSGLSQSLRNCRSIHDTDGKCVTFEMCPPFLKMLQSEAITPDKLRLLQRLTCGFDGDMPKICCPVTEIVDEVVENVQRFQTQSQNKLKPVTNTQSAPASQFLPRPGTKVPALSPVVQPPTSRPLPNTSTASTSDWSAFLPKESPVPEVSTNDRFQAGRPTNYRAHPNYNLIPSLKDCSNAVDTERIVGGKNAGLGAYPWMARIGYLNLETNEVEFYCGGTVINNRYILTAAHCTEEIDDEFKPVVIRVGEHDTTTDEDCSPYLGCVKAVDYVIDKIIPHGDYQKEDKSNDIELIRVNRDISFESYSVRPVCLPFPQEYGILDSWQKAFSNNQTKAWVTGWGRTKWNQAEGSNVLQEVQLPLLSNIQCQHNYSQRIEISEKQMCAGGIKAKDSCGGDSGGPLIYPITVNGEGKFFQLGVVSFGPVQCGIGGLPGVYTRISRYLDWILNNIAP